MSTGDSCELDDSATQTPRREEAAESLSPAEAEALVVYCFTPPPHKANYQLVVWGRIH